jgi:hypothetical protein
MDVAIEDLSITVATAEGCYRSVSAEMFDVIQKEQKWHSVPQK